VSTENKGSLQGGSNMTGTDSVCKHTLSVPVKFEPPCTYLPTYLHTYIQIRTYIHTYILT